VEVPAKATVESQEEPVKSTKARKPKAPVVPKETEVSEEEVLAAKSKVEKKTQKVTEAVTKPSSDSEASEEEPAPKPKKKASAKPTTQKQSKNPSEKPLEKSSKKEVGMIDVEQIGRGTSRTSTCF
jgi:hypothetical protein